MLLVSKSISMIMSAANDTIIMCLASVLLPPMDEDLCWIANVLGGRTHRGNSF